MQWIESLGMRSPEDIERLLNQITVGLGHAGLAARRSADASTLDISRSLLLAHTALLAALHTLQPSSAGRSSPSVLLHPPAGWSPPERWQDFVAGRPEPGRQRLRDGLQHAALATQEAGDAIRGNADRRVVTQSLARVAEALHAVRRDLLATEEGLA